MFFVFNLKTVYTSITNLHFFLFFFLFIHCDFEFVVILELKYLSLFSIDSKKSINHIETFTQKETKSERVREWGEIIKEKYWTFSHSISKKQSKQICEMFQSNKFWIDKFYILIFVKRERRNWETQIQLLNTKTRNKKQETDIFIWRTNTQFELVNNENVVLKKEYLLQNDEWSNECVVEDLRNE
jgi:hypothetical protein